MKFLTMENGVRAMVLVAFTIGFTLLWFFEQPMKEIHMPFLAGGLGVMAASSLFSITRKLLIGRILTVVNLVIDSTAALIILIMSVVPDSNTDVGAFMIAFFAMFTVQFICTPSRNEHLEKTTVVTDGQKKNWEPNLRTLCEFHKTTPEELAKKVGSPNLLKGKLFADSMRALQKELNFNTLDDIYWLYLPPEEFTKRYFK